MFDDRNELLRSAFLENPSVENYVALRRRYPNDEIEFSDGEAFEWVAHHNDDFEKFDIPMEVVWAALDADCAAISELSPAADGACDRTGAPT
jgi:hypothetical protein